MKPSRRFLRRLFLAVSLLVVFTLFGFFVLPAIVKSQLERRASTALDRHVTVERVRVNPYALSLTLENFAIREPDGTSHFLGWRRLYVNFEALASVRGEWVIGDIELDGFDARGRLNPDSSFNFSDLLAKFTPPPGSPPSPPPDKPARPIRVARLQVTDARVEVADDSRSQPFATVLGPTTFTLSEFRTVSDKGAPYRFAAVTEAGEKLSWSGTLQAEPFRSSGEFEVGNLALPKYAPYYADQVQADLTAGTLSVRGRYELDLEESHRTLSLTDGNVELRGITVLERGTQEVVLELPILDVSGIEADALALESTIRSVSVTGGRIRARREKDGTINLLALLPPPAATATPAPVPSPAPGTPAVPPGPTADVTVTELAVTGFQIEVDDQAAPRPAQLALNDVQLSLKDLSLAAGAQMPLQLAFAWAPEGTVRLGGTVALNPPAARLTTEVAGFALLPLSPYVEQFVNARLTEGVVSATLVAEADLPEGQPLGATVTGEITLEKFGLVDGVRSEELAGFGRLVLSGLRASTAPELALALDEINVAGSYARVIVNADKSLNLAAVAGTATAPPTDPAPDETPIVIAVAEPEAAPPAPTPSPPMKIEIGRVVISDGDYRFTDRSVEPNVRMAINQFGGTVSGLSSASVAKADLDLKAMIDGAGPMTISGKLDPLGARQHIDLAIDLKNVDLQPLSPYSGKYAGYELARGKLLLDVKLLVDDRKIESTNVITLNQFTFGGPVKSPEATSLPVRLGVALLKDTEGRIVIDVPVQGSLDDPSFGVGRVVLRVIVNLLTKAAVSPFSLLGAAFGGGGDELAFQEFAPGSAELQPAETRKLETMSQALANRPALSLDIAGSYDAGADSYALKRAKLADRIRRSIWEARRQAEPNIPPPEKLEISAEEHVAAMKKLYDEIFPPGTEFGAPVPPPPEVIAPPPPPQGLFQRIGRAVTFQARKEQRLAGMENARLAAEHEAAVAAALSAGLPLEEMTARLADTVTVDDNDLRELAQARAKQVRDYFTAVGQISSERLFLARTESDTAGAASDQTGKGPRVFLHLQ
jgi:hypothetical protein